MVFALMPLVTLAGPVAAEEWSVKTVARTEGSGNRCVIESSRQSLPDGYQTTTAYVTVDDRSVSVTTGANLDPSFADIGLVVGQEPLVPMDRLEGRRTVLFDSRYGRLIDLFKAGAQLRVQLRFWPEWPATGTHSATFSLIGFTKAYGALAGCH